VKPLERKLAREMRGEGASVKTIAARLGVSISSVSVWTRDVELTPDQREALRRANPINWRQHPWNETQRQQACEKRLAAQEHGRAAARRSDRLHQLGCMLYWAEGSKRRNQVVFTNSDADMMSLFLRFLRGCYGVADERMRLSFGCYLNNGLSLNDIEQWWLSRLGLSESCLRTSAVNRPSRASHFKRNTLPYGTARLVVHSTFVIQSIYGAIQEYAGIDRPEWLD
jgi:hypothetical protein